MLLKRFFNPAIPEGSTVFTIVQFVGFAFERVLTRLIWTAAEPKKSLLVILVLLLFLIMANATAKRLLYVGWPRPWAFLIIGPVMLNMLAAIHREDSSLVRAAAVLSGLLYLAYLALFVVLVFKKRKPVASHSIDSG